ncbi:DUF732 domain-containing protein [Mycolicibacter heraklionensis]|uniref:DUF732 domain-containing protein n=1 Tax=Mycolicibacter heraklionensis TaxID=512402 RepID=A0A9X7WK53_9MYCO|nr:DUF732 domain-containing protein [Mycolicibacter heraklionensis]QZA09765.1 DUF732 domain-containing protein [Mycolicibacter heraklionensis]
MTLSTKEAAMNRIKKKLGPGAAAAGLLIIGTAGEAHADDASFISSIHSKGIRQGMNDSTLIGLGHIMCSALRDGSSLDTVAGFPGGNGIFVDGHGIAVTAQQELCPDTIK